MPWKPKKYVPYIPKMLYAPLKAKDITWGDKDLIAKLYSDGKTESEIISLTKNRRAYVHNIILRLQHPEDFIIEPSNVKSTVKLCVLCNLEITGKRRQKYCASCRHEQKLASWRKHRAKYKFVKATIYSLVTFKCKICSKDFTASKWAERIYCGRACYFADPNRKKFPIKNPDNWQTIICQKCGTSFENRKSTIRKYCSTKCYFASPSHVWESKEADKWLKVNCLICGKSFETYKENPHKYCSKACYFKSRRNKRAAQTV